MAQNTSSGLSYYLLIEEVHQEDLAALREWSELKVAFDKNWIWITNFDAVQIESNRIKSIPYKTIFYSKDAKLYLQNSLLPDRNEPAFLWTPIERAFPIEIKKINHNYFGTNEKIVVQMVEDENIKEAEVMRTTMQSLLDYVQTAPEIRLKNIHWVVVNDRDVLLFGRPLLPINGAVFWKNKNAIIPVGYNFELPLLSKLIGSKVNDNNDFWVIWNKDGSYFLVEKNLIIPLTLSSVRKTFWLFDKSREKL